MTRSTEINVSSKSFLLFKFLYNSKEGLSLLKKNSIVFSSKRYGSIRYISRFYLSWLDLFRYIYYYIYLCVIYHDFIFHDSFHLLIHLSIYTLCITMPFHLYPFMTAIVFHDTFLTRHALAPDTNVPPLCACIF